MQINIVDIFRSKTVSYDKWNSNTIFVRLFIFILVNKLNENHSYLNYNFGLVLFLNLKLLYHCLQHQLCKCTKVNHVYAVEYVLVQNINLLCLCSEFSWGKVIDVHNKEYLSLAFESQQSIYFTKV